MKKHITIKRAKEIATYGVGYCNLQFLLNCKEPFAYTSTKTYGWRSDLYDVGGIIISTGYAPQGKQISYNITSYYEKLAQNIIANNSSYEKRRENLDKLIATFVKELERLEA